MKISYVESQELIPQAIWNSVWSETTDLDCVIVTKLIEIVGSDVYASKKNDYVTSVEIWKNNFAPNDIRKAPQRVDVANKEFKELTMSLVELISKSINAK